MNTMKEMIIYILIICLFFTLANDRNCWSRQDGKPISFAQSIIVQNIYSKKTGYRKKVPDKDNLYLQT